MNINTTEIRNAVTKAFDEAFTFESNGTEIATVLKTIPDVIGHITREQEARARNLCGRKMATTSLTTAYNDLIVHTHQLTGSITTVCDIFERVNLDIPNMHIQKGLLLDLARQIDAMGERGPWEVVTGWFGKKKLTAVEVINNALNGPDNVIANTGVGHASTN